jgi:hypothetical protein
MCINDAKSIFLLVPLQMIMIMGLTLVDKLVCLTVKAVGS